VASRSFAETDGIAFREMVLHPGLLGIHIEAAVAAQQLTFIAKYNFQPTQAFHLFYRDRVLIKGPEKNTNLLQIIERDYTWLDALSHA
jgi:hypothetical protein